MEINNKKNHLYRIIVFFIMILFATCLIMNVLFCGNHNLYKLLDKAAVFEAQTVSESIVPNENGDNTSYFDSVFLNKNIPHTETVTKKIYSIPVIAAIPNEFSVLFCCIIVYPFVFFYLFTLLSDKWTLVNQKIRLDI